MLGSQSAHLTLNLRDLSSEEEQGHEMVTVGLKSYKKGYKIALMLLITTLDVFNLFYLSIKSLSLGTKCVVEH